MSPLDAATPEALFGEAVRDAVALRRAYARLVRLHGPETDPDGFRQVRRLYEAAVAALATRPDDTAEALASDGAVAEAAPSSQEEAWVDAKLADATEQTLPALLDMLEERALAQRSGPALLATVGLAEAIAPTRTVGILARVNARWGLSTATAAVVELAVQSRSAIVLDPEWSELVEAVEDPTVRARLMLSELRTHLARRRPAATWARWEAWEGFLRTHAADGWAQLLGPILHTSAWEASEAAIARWIERVRAADVPLDDQAVFQLTARLCDVLDWRRAAADPAVAPDLLRAAREVSLADDHERLVLLRDFAERDFGSRILDLEGTHPGLAAMVHRAVESATGRAAALASWSRESGPDAQDLPPEPARLQAAGCLQRLEESRRSADEEARRRVEAGDGQALRWALAAGLAVAGGVGLAKGPWTATGFIAAAATCLYFAFRRSVAAPSTLQRDASADRAEVRTAILDAARQDGLWVHEVAAAVAGERTLPPVFDDLLAAPFSDLEVLEDAHLHRVSDAILAAREAVSS